MFDFFKKRCLSSEPSAVSESSDNRADRYPYSFSPGELNEYKLEFNYLNSSKPEVVSIVHEILELLASKDIPFDLAMQIPTALHDYIKLSYEYHTLKALWDPLELLRNDGDDQGDNGDDKSEN